MKKRGLARGAALALLLAILSGGIPGLAAWSDFPDIAGHWAEPAMRQAYDDGLVNGYADGTMGPDIPVSKAELITLLTRILAAPEQDDLSGTGPAEGKWYAQPVAQALALDIIGRDDLGDLERAIDRQDAFVLVARAFQLTPADQDLAPLAAFPDSGEIAYAARAPVAALAEAGYVQGSGGGRLYPHSGITRAEMVTLLGRMVGSYLLPGALDETVTGGASVPARAGRDGDTDSPSPVVELEDIQLNTDLLVNGYATELALDNVTTAHRIVVRSGSLEALTVTGGEISRLVLAATEGSVSFAPKGGGEIGAFVVGDGAGTVRLSGNIGQVEITGNDRTVYWTGDRLESLTISGSGNRVYLPGGSSAGSVTVLYGALDNRVEIGGRVDSLLVTGDRSTVSGDGYAGEIAIRGVDCGVSLSAGRRVDEPDYGLGGVDIVLTPSAEVVPPGGDLTVGAAFTGVRGDAVVAAQWYLNGEPVEHYGNSAFPLSPDRTSSYSPNIVYTRDMAASATVGLELTYSRSGEPQRVYREVTVELENYPFPHYRTAPTSEDKLVALTFDDGPNETYTNWLLDELREREVLATFYVLGENVARYPDTAARIVAEGHEIGSHSYSHPYLTSLSRANVESQLNRTNEAVLSATGVYPATMRPPHGAHNQTVRDAAKSVGQPVILWSVDTLDWSHRNPNESYRRVFNDGSASVRDGDIILMHDPLKTSVEGALLIVDRLLAEGYTLVTVSELLELRYGGGNPGATYYGR